jgi:hypothetical protein
MRRMLSAWALAGAVAAPLAVQAQSGAAVVHWQLQVVQDGKVVDDIARATPYGQTEMVTHALPVTHAVGCKEQPAASIDLVRRLSVTPARAENGAVSLAIDAHEMIEEPEERKTASGCALPPQPRRVNASHPGLVVPDGQQVDWTIIEKEPALVYRVRVGTH